MKPGFIFSFSALVVIGTASVGAAATVTNVSARANCGGIFANTDSGSGPVQVTQAANTADCTSIANARAGAGYVGAFAVTSGKAQVTGTGGSSSAIAGALAAFDIVFVPPPSYAGGLIDISATYFYEGLMNAAPRTKDIYNLTATVAYSGFFELRGKVSNLTTVSDKAVFADSYTRTVQLGTDDPTPALEPSAVGVTNTLSINPIHGATVTMNLQASATTAFNSTDLSAATADFYNSLSFAKTGPVFNLPVGFSAYSVDGSIVDNRWMDPRIVAGPSPVPVPASILFLLTGGLAIGVAGKKRHA